MTIERILSSLYLIRTQLSKGAIKMINGTAFCSSGEYTLTVYVIRYVNSIEWDTMFEYIRSCP